MPDLQSDSKMTEEKAKANCGKPYNAWRTNFLFEKLIILAIPAIFLVFTLHKDVALFLAGVLVDCTFWCVRDYLKSRDFILNKMPLIMQGKTVEAKGGK
jgi:hypothetical protein